MESIYDGVEIKILCPRERVSDDGNKTIIKVSLAVNLPNLVDLGRRRESEQLREKKLRNFLLLS